MHNFPTQPTIFIGRTEEINEVCNLMEDPGCRLLTLSGPGGIGKTRLAIEAAFRLAEKFSQGAFFVPLQSITTADGLVQAIADSMRFSLSGSDKPEVQLLNYLRDKKALLVLDNFEQLLSPSFMPGQGIKEDSIDLISEVLRTASNVKLMVTSRQALKLQSEWVYVIEGMVFPRSLQVENIETYSAVELFVERAQRIHRGFSLAEELEHVVQICQLVEGMPLAIELAASWSKSLDCGGIAVELQRSLSLLTTSWRDTLQRHQNMQMVFQHSWDLLSQDEKDTFKRLSIFQGGFQREAAERVAHATLSGLSMLVDKSLLRRDESGRYQVHELLRQYGEEKFRRSPQEAEIVLDRHCTFYSEFLVQKLEEILAGRQLQATQEIRSELENIRRSWGRAVDQVKIEEIQNSIGALVYFFQFQGRYFEGAQFYGDAIRRLEELDSEPLRDLTLAELLDGQGWLLLRLGQLDQAKEALEQSLAIYKEINRPPAPRMGTEPRTGLGVLANIQGEYEKAIAYGEEAYQLSEAQANKWNMMFAVYVLTNAALAKGDVENAKAYARQAYALAEDVNDRWFKAFILNDLGSTSIALGEYSKAQEYFQASYAIRKEFDDPGGMAEALNHLGKIAVLREEYTLADKTFRESLSMYGEINDKGGLAAAYEGLGTVACATRDYRSAGNFFSDALQIAHEIQFLPLIISIASNVGEMWMCTGQVEQSVELLSAVLHHSGSGNEMRKKAEDLLAQCRAMIQEDLFEAAERRGQDKAREDRPHPLFAEPIVFFQDHLGVDPVQVSTHDMAEPLTSRELEVLGLIAEGLRNREIADRLIITLGTVKWYNNQIYSKLHVTNRTQAVARARDLNLLL